MISLFITNSTLTNCIFTNTPKSRLRDQVIDFPRQLQFLTNNSTSSPHLNHYYCFVFQKFETEVKDFCDINLSFHQKKI